MAADSVLSTTAGHQLRFGRALVVRSDLLHPDNTPKCPCCIMDKHLGLRQTLKGVASNANELSAHNLLS